MSRMKFDFAQEPPKPPSLEEAWKLIDELRGHVRYQQEKLSTNSADSSKPPSADMVSQKKKRKRRRNGKSGRKQGAQPGRTGKARESVPPEEVDSAVVCLPPKVCDCGCKITVKPNSFKRHQVFELPPIKPIVTEYRQVFGMCDTCGSHYFGQLPAGVPSGILGPRAIAAIGNFSGEYRLSKRLTENMFNDFFNLPVSAGTVSNAERTVSEALKEPAAEAHQYIKTRDAVHSDETRHKRSGNKMRMRAGVAVLAAVFMIRTNRNAASARELLGKTFRGILISDRFSSYNWVEITRRQLCWAHIQREFVKISERSGESGRIGDLLLGCAKRMFRLRHMTRDGPLTRSQFIKCMEPITEAMVKLLEQGAACENKKTASTCRQLLKQKAGLWTFVEIEGVEPTNNLAEQIIRTYVMWRKLSYGTQSERGDRFAERVLTATATCRLQKRNSLEYMTAAVSAYLRNEPAPSLLPNSEVLPPVKMAA